MDNKLYEFPDNLFKDLLKKAFDKLTEDDVKEVIGGLKVVHRGKL